VELPSSTLFVFARRFKDIWLADQSICILHFTHSVKWALQKIICDMFRLPSAMSSGHLMVLSNVWMTSRALFRLVKI
jgi:hypothetical protein